MDYRIISNGCVTLWIHTGQNVSPCDAETYIRRALALHGLRQWRCIHIEAICGNGGTLLIASPGTEFTVSIAGYALPFLKEYFTE